MVLHKGHCFSSPTLSFAHHVWNNYKTFTHTHTHTQCWALTQIFILIQCVLPNLLPITFYSSCKFFLKPFIVWDVSPTLFSSDVYFEFPLIGNHASFMTLHLIHDTPCHLSLLDFFLSSAVVETWLLLSELWQQQWAQCLIYCTQ